MTHYLDAKAMTDVLMMGRLLTSDMKQWSFPGWIQGSLIKKITYQGCQKHLFVPYHIYLLYKVKEKELYLIFGAFMLFLEMYTTRQSIHTSINLTMYLFKTCAQLGAFCISKKPD